MNVITRPPEDFSEKVKVDLGEVDNDVVMAIL